ncbi:MAG: ECF transporter S component [Clostridia bacterium]|nr:ECF transporter S component [Clostridia bacterium]
MKRIIPYIIAFLLIPAVIVTGIVFFENKQYSFISLAIALLTLFLFFFSFERKETAAAKLVVIAVMTAISVAGRIIFAVLPGFKPVTAIVVITAIYLGREAGFITGSLSALLSNFYFGQGPWSPFQMLTWGLIGWFAAVFSNKLKNSRVALSVYGFFAGIAFSLVLDIWSAIWMGGTFSVSRYFAVLASSLPFTAVYAVSNVVFLLLIGAPVGKKLERIIKKYGL